MIWFELNKGSWYVTHPTYPPITLPSWIIKATTSCKWSLFCLKFILFLLWLSMYSKIRPHLCSRPEGFKIFKEKRVNAECLNCESKVLTWVYCFLKVNISLYIFPESISRIFRILGICLSSFVWIVSHEERKMKENNEMNKLWWAGLYLRFS